MVDEVLPLQPMRQWVLSVPFPLRFLFASNPKAMAGVLGIVYLEETLPQFIKHADIDSSVSCHAVFGDKESMLRSLELMVSHNHIGDWSVYRRSPTLESILDDPRFIALEKQVSEELERQRVMIEAMYAEQSTGS